MLPDSLSWSHVQQAAHRRANALKLLLVSQISFNQIVVLERKINSLIVQFLGQLHLSLLAPLKLSEE